MNRTADIATPRAAAATFVQFVRDFLRLSGRRASVAATMMAFGALLEGVSLAILIPLLGILTDAGTGGGLGSAAASIFAWTGARSTQARLGLALGAFVLLVITRAIVLARRDRVLAMLQNDFVEHQRRRILDALAAARWHDLVGLRHARIGHALSSDIPRIAATAQLLLQAVVAMAMLVAQGILVMMIAPRIAIVAIALLLFGTLALIPVMRSAHDVGRRLGMSSLTMVDGVGQLLGGVKIAMAQNLQHQFVAEVAATGESLTAHQFAFQQRQSRLRIASTSVYSLAGAAVIFVGVQLQTPTVTLIAALAIFLRMSGPANMLQQSAQTIASLVPAYSVVETLAMDLRGEASRDLPPSSPRDLPPGPIVLAHAGYAHPDGDGTRGVRDINLTIAPGERIAVTGPSGAGKTTLVDLLAGLIGPDAGEVRVGEVALDDTTVTAWREHIAYVGQDSYLFSDTIRRNIGWGRPGVDDATMLEACTLVGADALVAQIRGGLDAVLAERGMRLSGGERQRLALARALVRKPRLLILDEATNAIDIASEREIFTRLKTISPAPAVVVVAHRPSTIEACERLLRLEHGRLVEDRAIVAG